MQDDPVLPDPKTCRRGETYTRISALWFAHAPQIDQYFVSDLFHVRYMGMSRDNDVCLDTAKARFEFQTGRI
jgi:hypothetical protein